MKERETAVWLTWRAQERRSGEVSREERRQGQRARLEPEETADRKTKEIEVALSIQESEEKEAPQSRYSQAQVPKGALNNVMQYSDGHK